MFTDARKDNCVATLTHSQHFVIRECVTAVLPVMWQDIHEQCYLRCGRIYSAVLHVVWQDIQVSVTCGVLGHTQQVLPVVWHDIQGSVTCGVVGHT